MMLFGRGINWRRSDGGGGWLGRRVVGLHLDTCRILRAGHARLVGLDVGPETVFVCHVGDLPVNAVLVAISVAAMDLLRAAAPLLAPLFVSVVVLDVVSVAVWLVVVRVGLARGAHLVAKGHLLAEAQDEK